MDDAHEPVAHLGLPLAVAAAGGAAVVSSMTRWWLCGPFNGAIAVAVAALIGAWIGTALTHSLRCDPPRVTGRKAAGFLLLAAPLCVLVITLACDGTQLSADTMLLGVAFAGVLLPAAWLTLRLARVAQRSRERSLLGRSDRRAAWRATAVWLAVAASIGAVPSFIDGREYGYFADMFWWSAADKAAVALGPLLVASAASAIAVAVAFLDWRAERIVVRARSASEAWRVDAAPASSTGMDVGVGEDAWMEHVDGSTTYRSLARERVAAIGDLERGARYLHKATRRSAIALTIVGAAVLVSLYVYAVVLRRAR